MDQPLSEDEEKQRVFCKVWDYLVLLEYILFIVALRFGIEA